ncbi:MAG: hypothetical protein RL119_530 [Actinomycetota bacterium]|jgi:limonene-1,2-epoxide hydrolase
MTPVEVVHAFIGALERNDIEAALQFVDESCEYDNVPIGKVYGHEGVKTILAPMFARCTEITWPIHREATFENVVFNERTDKFKMEFGWIELQVTGVWEVVNDKITLWRDYFDMQSYLKQFPADNPR